jgi:transcriptional regulator NrdR family protein
MENRVVIVKRRGHKEKFDEKKIYASIYFACMSAYRDEIKCEKLSEKVTNKIKAWIKNKRIVDSSQIREKVIAELRKENKKVEFYYAANVPNVTRL